MVVAGAVVAVVGVSNGPLCSSVVRAPNGPLCFAPLGFLEVAAFEAEAVAFEAVFFSFLLAAVDAVVLGFVLGLSSKKSRER